MDRLLVATRSTGKKLEIAAILQGAGVEIVFPEDVGLDYSAEEETIEDQSTYEGNSLRKAAYFAQLSGLPTVADDSGIEVDALGGRPGVSSKRYAPECAAQDAANNSLMLSEMEGVPEEERTARYRCVAVFLESTESAPQAFEGVCEGRILSERAGSGGFGYDPIFFSTELGKGLGTVEQELKERVSHRGRAFRAFREWLLERNQSSRREK